MQGGNCSPFGRHGSVKFGLCHWLLKLKLQHCSKLYFFVLAETELDQSEKKMPTEAPLSICEQLESLRLQIILKWDEIQAMKKEIKDTMTFAGIANIRERTVKELEVRQKHV